MDWWQAVDIYCERTAAGFWNEPLNALSNASFVIAALWAAMTAHRQSITAPIVWLLIGMAGLIGVGSFLFHTFANRWSELADVIPIWSFVAVFVLTAMHFIGGMSVKKVFAYSGLIAALAIGTVLFLATGEAPATVDTAPDPLNGSGQYAPAVIALIVFSALSRWRGHAGAPWILAATLTFLVSLAFRTIDRDICSTFPVGTHFLWHSLNGVMIALLLQMLVRTGRFSRA